MIILGKLQKHHSTHEQQSRRRISDLQQIVHGHRNLECKICLI